MHQIQAAIAAKRLKEADGLLLRSMAHLRNIRKKKSVRSHLNRAGRVPHR